MHHAIKDRVYERLSKIFSDSETPHDTVAGRQPEATPQGTHGKSLSSVLSSVIPSVSFDWFRQNEVPDDMKSDGSHSFYKWRSKSFSWKEKPLKRHLECDNEYETQQNGEHGSGSPSYQESFGSPSGNGEMRSSISTSSCSDVFEDVHTPNSFDKSMSSLMDESRFINPDIYQFFEASLPNIVKGCQWVLLYSTARDGISLQTLYRKGAGLSGPCLLITGDKQGAVFGGLIDCPLRPTAKRKYQGTNQSFVFSTIYGEPRLFRPTGANRYFCLCLNDLLALGGGGHFALCLNEDLLSGTSGPCETFGNLCLAHDQEFEAKNVELWGITHSSQYIH